MHEHTYKNARIMERNSNNFLRDCLIFLLYLYLLYIYIFVLNDPRKTHVHRFLGIMNFSFKSIIHRQRPKLFLIVCSHWQDQTSWPWVHMHKNCSIPFFYTHQPNLSFDFQTAEQKPMWRSSSWPLLFAFVLV